MFSRWPAHGEYGIIIGLRITGKRESGAVRKRCWERFFLVDLRSFFAMLFIPTDCSSGKKMAPSFDSPEIKYERFQRSFISSIIDNHQKLPHIMGSISRFFEACMPFYTIGTCAHYWFTYHDTRQSRCRHSYSDTYNQYKTSLRLNALENKLSDLPSSNTIDETKPSWFRDAK